MSDDVMKRLRDKVEKDNSIDDPAAAVIEPEIRTPSQYAMYPTTPNDDED